MMRDSIGKALLAGLAAVLFLLVVPAIVCVGQQLQLIGPIPGNTLQYKTDEFLVFFSPAVGDAGLEGLRFSLTNTTGNTLTINWQESYFILPGGGWSEAVTPDIPTSFQQSTTQVSIRQTVEIVAIPLSNVSYSESGWSVGAIEAPEDSEFTLHLALERAADTGTGTLTEGHDFTFRVVDAWRGGSSDIGSRLPAWSALLALGVGLLLGLLLTTP